MSRGYQFTSKKIKPKYELIIMSDIGENECLFLFQKIFLYIYSS